jgi:MYXO-CTERM domain-containing protein
VRPTGILAAALIVSHAAAASARQVMVATPTDLAAALAAAQPGDEIILADGQYNFGGADCTANGTADAPIAVHAQHPLFAVLLSTALEGFKVSGANWQFSGLDVRGVCPNDADCEHAFHVFGGADGFVLRASRVSDFNAQLKVNAAPVTTGGPYVIPNRGVVEGNEIFDTHARNTTTPVTKLDIDTGDGWIVRANYVHDFGKTNTDAVYAAFMKSGSSNGLFERNLVICDKDQMFMNTQVGLSFGGGGTAPQFCAPAFDANTPCSVEHSNGTMRNNIVVNCTDVGIYLNQAQNSHLLHNTLIVTAGIDFRFANSSGEARGNLMSSMIHLRDGATDSESDNIINVPMSQFFAWFVDPLNGDLRKLGNQSAFQQLAPPLATVPDDYCARTRTDPKYDVGALETTLGDCVTLPPPLVGGLNPFPFPDLGAHSDGGAGVRGAPGCGCRLGGEARAPWLACALALALLVATRRRWS